MSDTSEGRIFHVRNIGEKIIFTLEKIRNLIRKGTYRRSAFHSVYDGNVIWRRNYNISSRLD